MSSEKQCAQCSSKESPQWRRGANGEILCNKCGIKYMTDRRNEIPPPQLEFHSTPEPIPQPVIQIPVPFNLHNIDGINVLLHPNIYLFKVGDVHAMIPYQDMMNGNFPPWLFS